MKLSERFKVGDCPKSDTVRVFIVSCNENIEFFDELYTYLTLAERERASRFRFMADKKRFVLGRAILRGISGHFLDKSPREIQFTYGAQGKPYFCPKMPLKFNVSHSGDIIALAFTSEYSIGVDVELIKHDFSPIKLATNFFSNAEIKELREKKEIERKRAFFRCWTRKESFIKALGDGLSFPLDTFSVSCNTDHEAELLHTAWDTSERLKWKLFSFIPNEQYIGSIAVRNRLSKVNVQKW